MKTIYYTAVGWTKNPFILSWLKQQEYKPEPYQTILLGQHNVDEVENSKESFIFHSMMEGQDLQVLDEIIQKLKKLYPVLKVNIIVGGTLINVIEVEDLQKAYPEITHICIDKGEFVSYDIVFYDAPPGFYNGAEYPKVAQYPISKNYWQLPNQLLLTIDDCRCRWGQCRYCHHFKNVYNTRPRTTPYEAAELFLQQREFMDGIPAFQFYDNDLNLKKLYEFFLAIKKIATPEQLDMLRETNFSLFGVRPDSKHEYIQMTIDELGFNPIESVALGIEIFNDEALEIYNKNCTREDIVKCLDFYSYDTPQTNISNNMLVGLPLLGHKHYESSRDLAAKYDSEEYHMGFNWNFFRVNDEMDMFSHPEDWKIRLDKPYMINDFIKVKKLPDIRTKYWKFDTWDIDYQKWLSRIEVKLKYMYLVEDTLDGTIGAVMDEDGEDWERDHKENSVV